MRIHLHANPRRDGFLDQDLASHRRSTQTIYIPRGARGRLLRSPFFFFHILLFYLLLVNQSPSFGKTRLWLLLEELSFNQASGGAGARSLLSVFSLLILQSPESKIQQVSKKSGWGGESQQAEE